DGHTLVVIDDSELLNISEIIKIYDIVVNQSLSTLILSGRLIPVNELPNVKIISLAGLSMVDLAKARLKLVPESTDIDKAFGLIEDNPALLEAFIFTPLDVIQRLLDLFIPKVTQIPETSPANIENLKVNIQHEKDSGPDRIGIALSIILFIVSTLSSLETEDNIVNEIHGIQEVIAELLTVDSNQVGVNIHYATTFLNLRKLPNVEKGNVITVLAPNQIFTVLSVNEGWAEISYTVHVSSKEKRGWVFSKYIKSVSDKQN
ncbi:MAG: SH3 domain-containing protein, partial [Gammaproteobacteria bacterium]|nr:SH3 domain-containing protein [Gammaproteobacteria bacterium]